MTFRLRSCLPGLVLSSAVALAGAPVPAGSTEFFENRIRPILANNCYGCHTNSKLGGLRVDSREALLAGGSTGPALIPGDPEKSLLIKAVAQGGDLKMPKGGKLKKEEIDDLIAWVKARADWPAAAKAPVPPSKP